MHACYLYMCACVYTYMHVLTLANISAAMNRVDLLHNTNKLNTVFAFIIYIDICVYMYML